MMLTAGWTVFQPFGTGVTVYGDEHVGQPLYGRANRCHS